MTSDQGVEVMARAIRCARFPWEKWEFLPPASKNAAMDEARAAIRALHAAGGLVLREMPGEKDHMNAPPRLGAEEAEGWGLGYSHALVAVRALAVEVGE